MIEYPFGQAKSIGPGKRLAAKIKAGKQERAEKRTRKSELISEHGRKTGKQLHKVEHASDRQKQKAQERTKASEEMSAKGIEMNKRGYAKRKQVEESGYTGAGNYKKTKTIRGKGGNIKRTKTLTQVSPQKREGIDVNTWTAKIEKTGKYPKYRKKGLDSQAVMVGAVGAAGAFLGLSHRSVPRSKK
jgi:hypothetical protein